MRAVIQIILCFCALASTARAEVVFDNQLYWVEDGKVFRGGCPSQVGLYDHAHCNNDIKQTTAASFFTVLAKPFGRALAIREKRANEHFAMLRRVDDRLAELLATVPAGDMDAARADVSKAEDVLASATQKRAEMRDQIARLQQGLAQHADDATILEQLLAARAVLPPLESAVTTAEANLLAARKKMVGLGAADGDLTFQDLVEQGAATAERYATARALVDAEIADMRCGAIAAARVRETGFVWERLCDVQQTTLSSGKAFEQLSAAFTAEADAPNTDIQSIELYDSGSGSLWGRVCTFTAVKWVECDIGLWDGAIKISGGGLDVALSVQPDGRYALRTSFTHSGCNELYFYFFPAIAGDFPKHVTCEYHRS